MAKPLNVNVTDAPYNATGNGTTDDRAAIQSAIDAVAAAGGGCVYFPKGTYLVGTEPGGSALGGLQMKSKVLLQGEAPRAAVIKMANSINRHVIYGPSNVNSLWGTNGGGGLEDWCLLNIEIDGNRANNTSGSGIWIYGFKMNVQNLFIREIAEYGWRTEWGGSTSSPFNMEGTVSNVNIYNTGKHGFWFGGPNDSVITNVIVVNASQTTHNTYDSFNLYNSSSRFIAIHSWNESTVTNRARYGLYDEIGAHDFIGCQFEGAYSANVYLVAGQQRFNDCRIFAAANGKNVVIKATETVLRATISDPLSGGPACKGVILGESGDYVAANDIDVFVREQGAGAIDFTNSSGDNSIRVRGFLPSGTTYVGTPQASDYVDFLCNGASGGALQQSWGGQRYTDNFLSLSETDGITAAGSTQGTATALGTTSAAHVTTTASNTGVKLLTNSTPGKLIYVHNSGANTLKVYPASGQKINNLATNAAFSIGTTKGASFIYGTDRWMACLSA